MNSNLVVYQLGMHSNPTEDNVTIQIELVDMGREGFLRCPVFITLDGTQSAELFAGELRDAADDIDRWVRQMSRSEQ